MKLNKIIIGLLILTFFLSCKEREDSLPPNFEVKVVGAPTYKKGTSVQYEIKSTTNRAFKKFFIQPSIIGDSITAIIDTVLPENKNFSYTWRYGIKSTVGSGTIIKIYFEIWDSWGPATYVEEFEVQK